MYASFFGYNLSKPYPYRWFTPLVITCGLVLVVLLSLFNLASNGYTLSVQYSHNPNNTVANRGLPHLPLFLTSKMQPSCQSTTIPVNTRLMTNNSALTYTLTGVSQAIENSPGESAGRNMSSSLVYHNNLLSYCTIASISIQLGIFDRTAAQISVQNWGIDAQAYLNCGIDIEDQRDTNFNLTAEYNLVPPSLPVNQYSYQFVGRDQDARPSLYWAESLLATYWLNVSSDVYYANFEAADETLATVGTITYTWNNKTSNITDDAFFDRTFQFVAPQSTRSIWLVDEQLVDSFTDPQWKLFNSSDQLAKVLYSTALTDLGQNTTKPNILADPSLLAHFTAGFVDSTHLDYILGGLARTPFNPSNTTYNELLVVNPSTLSATYLCQVPQRKQWDTLVISILVADLVILQALWKVLNLATTTYLTRNDKQANFCEGCRSRRESSNQASDEMSLKSIRSGRDHDYDVLSMASNQHLLSPGLDRS